MKVFESDHVTQDWYSGKKGRKEEAERVGDDDDDSLQENNREKRRASQANPRHFNVKLFVKTLTLTESQRATLSEIFLFLVTHSVVLQPFSF